jgi:hypothetical protein
LQPCIRCKKIDECITDIWMGNFDRINELEIPLERDILEDREFYTIGVCNQCLEEWLSCIQKWFQDSKRELC